MKKTICFVICAVIAFCSAFMMAGCSARSEILKIYNWGEYMAEEVIPLFEQWYRDNTGKNIEVRYVEYETNEDMLTQIERKKKDYDLVCPSEYMLARMAKAGLLRELDETTKKAVRQNIHPQVISLLREAFREEGDDNDENNFLDKYSVPFVWGTMGILYNVKSDGINDEIVSHWNALWNPEFKTRIYMKDSVRDSYTIAMLKEYEQQLIAAITYDSDGNAVYGDEYRALLEEIFYRMDDDKIAVAESLLKSQKKLVRAYEVDSAKDDMLGDVDGKKNLLGAFWSCDAGYIMSLSETDANLNLRYIVPQEGSNVWVDSFVIPKYARNPEAANLFLQFLCNYDQFNEENDYALDADEYDDIAFLNMDYIGSTTAVKSSMDSYREYLEWLEELTTMTDDEAMEELREDGDGEINEYDYASWQNLKKAPEEFFDMYLDMLFPPDDILSRCAVMKDVEEYNAALDEMWLKVRIY